MIELALFSGLIVLIGLYTIVMCLILPMSKGIRELASRF